MPPCLDQSEFNRRLIKPADFSIEDFESRRARVRELESLTHDIVFTHGDIAPHNILVLDDGRIGGLIDWEAAGYYPEYWEYTTAYGLAKKGWWFDLVWELANGRYTAELGGDRERWLLTNGTMI
jgi:aminoglycoside phosphotransferase